MKQTPRSLKEVTWAVVDVETTGLSPRGGDRVCEIAVVRAGPEGVLSLQTLVHPGRPISPEASLVNGITDEMVADAPPFAQVAPEVERRLRGAVFVSHNVPFDRGFLQAEFDACGRTFPPEPSVDTVTLARLLLRLPSHRLEDVAARLGVSIEHRHRALGDAQATWGVLERFLSTLAGQGVNTLEDLLRAQGDWTGISGAAAGGLPEASAASAEDTLAALKAAIQAGRPLRLTYLSSGGEVTDRTVEPLGLIEWGANTYLEAFCRLRRDKRHFRLDRIRDVHPA